MKTGKRLYINITNKCNTDCPFCCMYSGTNNHLNMDFDTYKNIIDSCEKEFELQLEGGEPLLHPNLYLFIEYAVSKQKCKKILILTNGILLEKNLRRFVDILNLYDIEIEFKVSINYWLIKVQPDHIENIKRCVFDIKYMPKINITCNVRLRKEDGLLEKEILEDNILKNISNIYYLQSYGKLSDSEYEKPVIVQNIEEWTIYAVDGQEFGMDLIARSEYEYSLQQETD